MRLVGSIKLYDLHELEEMLGLSKVTLRSYIKSGIIKARKLGVKWYVAEQHINQFLQINKQDGSLVAGHLENTPTNGRHQYEFSDLSSNLPGVKTVQPVGLRPNGATTNGSSINIHLLANAYDQTSVANGLSTFDMWLGNDGSLKTISPLCEVITGYNTKEFIYNQELYLDMIHPEDRKLATKRISESLITSAPLSIEVRAITKRGEIRYLLITSDDVSKHDSNIVGKRFEVTDITESKQLEIAKPNPFFEALCANYDLDVIVFDNDLNVAQVSGLTKLNSLFLFNADPTIGMSFAEIIPQEFQLQIKQFIYQAQNGYNGHCNFEHSYKGLTKVYSFAFFPAAKVSKRKQLEKIPVMLVIEEQKLIQAECENILCINPSTYNAFPFMIQILDNNRIIRDVNPKWLEVTGYTKSEVIGKSLTYFLDSNSNSVLQENPINCEVQYLNDVVVNIMTKDGTTLSCSNESILHVSKERQMLELSIMHPLI